MNSSNEGVSHRLVLSSLSDKIAAFVKQLQSALPNMESSKAPSLVLTIISEKSGSRQLTAVWIQHYAIVAKEHLKYAAEEAVLIKQEVTLNTSRNLLIVKHDLEEVESGLGVICSVGLSLIYHKIYRK